MKPLALLALLLAGCYSLDDLVSPMSTSSIQLVGEPQTSAGGSTIPIPSGIVPGDLLLLSLLGTGAGIAGWTPEQYLASQCSAGGSLQAWRRTADGSEGATLALPINLGGALLAYRGVGSTGGVRSLDSTDYQTTSVAAPVSAAAGDLVVARVAVGLGSGAAWTASDGFQLRAQSAFLAVFDGPAGDPPITSVTLSASMGECPISLTEALTPK